MDEILARVQVSETGRMLLSEELVARTWGNFSCRVDETHFCITPSGLGYEEMKENDIVLYDSANKSYAGTRKPSSEKGIHAAAYEIFPNVNFVIHTHQTYATALGLAGFDMLTQEEKSSLGGVEIAGYGLPGTKTLKKNVAAALQRGAQIVLMEHHGALVCGADREEAITRARRLEEICRCHTRGIEVQEQVKNMTDIMSEVKEKFPTARHAVSDALLTQANRGAMHAQLDDMAQMIGGTVPVVPCSPDAICEALTKRNAVLVPMLGAVTCGIDEDDSEALRVLCTKAAVSACHTDACGVWANLSAFDIALMRFVYRQKYAKLKKR